MSEPVWGPHDSFCACFEGPCCPWMGACECQCDCDRISAIREDERSSIIDVMERKAFTPMTLIPPQCRGGHEVEEWHGRHLCIRCGTETQKSDTSS